MGETLDDTAPKGVSFTLGCIGRHLFKQPIIAEIALELGITPVKEIFKLRLDVRRENAASHLAFGFGRHFCLGAHLARMEVRAIFKELLPRLDHIELDGDPSWIKANFVQGPKSIPIRYGFR